MAAETANRDLDHAVMAPAKEGMSKSAGDAHRLLHHLDRPRYFRRASVRPTPADAKRGTALQVAVHNSVDRSRAMTLNEFHVDLHAVREGRSDHTMHDCAWLERTALQTELLQPRPPALELLPVFD